jgi:hypothetical protein
MIPPHPETSTATSTSPRPNPTILRPGRNAFRQTNEIDLNTSYGNSIHERHESTIRIFFQNVRGLTYSATGEDYGYYLSCVSSLGADIIGMAETNSAWEHSHIRTTFHATARKQFQSHKVHFSSPSKDIDPMPDTESFQSGGTLTLATNTLVPMALGDPSKDIWPRQVEHYLVPGTGRQKVHSLHCLSSVQRPHPVIAHRKRVQPRIHTLQTTRHLSSSTTKPVLSGYPEIDPTPPTSGSRNFTHVGLQ